MDADVHRRQTHPKEVTTYNTMKLIAVSKWLVLYINKKSSKCISYHRQNYLRIPTKGKTPLQAAGLFSSCFIFNFFFATSIVYPDNQQRKTPSLWDRLFGTQSECRGVSKKDCSRLGTFLLGLLYLAHQKQGLYSPAPPHFIPCHVAWPNFEG